MLNRAGVAWGVLVTVATTSCDDRELDGNGAVEVTDSAGVQIVFTRIGPDAPTCSVSEETLRIGSVDEQEGTTLFGVNGVAVLGDGRIAVVNSGTSQVKVFSPTGLFLNEFGRQGEGPTEFENLWSVAVRGEDTLVVGDYRPWRFSFFTPQGEMVRRVQLEPAEIERPDFALPLGAGLGFIVEDPAFQVQDEWVDRVVPLWVYGENGMLADTVGHFWLDRYGYHSKEMGYVGNSIFGAHASFSHLRDDLILYATGRHEQLEIWNVAGERRRIVRWQSRDRVVGPNDADEWRRQRRAEIEARFQVTPALESVIEARTGEHLPVADLYPGHSQVVVSHEGDIWVQEYRRPLDEGPARWWVFGEDGRFLCSLSLPKDFGVMAVRENRVFGLAFDSLDVEYVVGYEVAGPLRRAP